MRRETKIKNIGSSDGDPIVVLHYERSYLFGLIKIYILVEDRRPDLNEMIGKYKHQIRFKLFRKEVSIVTRSTTGIGTYLVDGKTLS